MFNKAPIFFRKPCLKRPTAKPFWFHSHQFEWVSCTFNQWPLEGEKSQYRGILYLWPANGKSGIGIHSPSFWGLDARETVPYKSPCAALLRTETTRRMRMSPAQLAMVRAAPELVKDGRLAESCRCMRSDWGSFKGGSWTLQVSSSSSVILSGSHNPVTQ